MDKNTEKELVVLEDRCKRTAAALYSLIRTSKCFDLYLQNICSEAKDEIVQNSLLVTTVVNYCRPFSTNRTREGKKYQYPIKPLKSSEKYSQKVHELLLDLRNMLIAHDDAGAMDTKLSYMAASINENQNNQNAVITINTNAGMVYTLESKELSEKISVHLTGMIKKLKEMHSAELSSVLNLLRRGNNFSEG